MEKINQNNVVDDQTDIAKIVLLVCRLRVFDSASEAPKRTESEAASALANIVVQLVKERHTQPEDYLMPELSVHGLALAEARSMLATEHQTA